MQERERAQVQVQQAEHVRQEAGLDNAAGTYAVVARMVDSQTLAAQRQADEPALGSVVKSVEVDETTQEAVGESNMQYGADRPSNRQLLSTPKAVEQHGRRSAYVRRAPGRLTNTRVRASTFEGGLRRCVSAGTARSAPSAHRSNATLG